MGRTPSALRRAGEPNGCPCPGTRRRLTLWIGAVCAAWFDTAQAQPVLLRPSSTLATAPVAESVRKTGEYGFARELSGIGLADDSPSAALRQTTTLSKRLAGSARQTAAQPDSRLRLAPELALAQDEPPAPRQQPSPRQAVAMTPNRAASPDERTPAAAAGAATRTLTLGQAGMAATGTQGPEAPLPPEAVRPGPAPTVSRDSAPQGELPDLTAITSWAIPPIRWGGNTTSNYGWNGAAETQTFSETQAVNLRASSYIYQPWYAQVSGDVGLLTGTSKQSSTAEGGQDTSSKNTAITYGGNLSLFPQSRFPFQAYLQSSDSRATANSATAAYTSMRMGARQNYRPEVGQENYSGSVDRSIVTSGAIRSIVDALQGNFSTTLAEHSVSANARYSRNLGDVSGQGSNLLGLAASHSWRNDEDLTVASSASYSNNQIRVLGGDSGLIMNNSQVMQAGSSVTWLPDEDLPLTVVGGGNFLHLNTNTGTAATAVTNLNGYANANYRISNNLQATGGVTLSQNQANGVTQFASGQNAALSYSGDALTFGNYSYNWGTGANVANQIVTGAGTNSSVGGSAQHSVSRHVNLAPGSTISLNAGQGFSLSGTTGSGQVGVLTHTGGASWRQTIGERSLGVLSASASDSMSTGAFSSHFRSLTTQGNFQTQLTARSTLGANMNFVVSQQLKTTQAPTTTGPFVDTTPPATDNGNGNTTMSGSGSVSYSHRNPFDITNLMYTATLQLNASQTNLRLVAADPNAMMWQTGTVFQQNADYRIGRLIFRATGTYATFNGKENASIFLTIGRELGDM